MTAKSKNGMLQEHYNCRSAKAAGDLLLMAIHSIAF